jgi:hypothetical protein
MRVLAPFFRAFLVTVALAVLSGCDWANVGGPW